MCKKVDAEIIKKLEKIVGEENVLTQNEEKEPYSHDETTTLKYFPEIVVRPRHKEEIKEVLVLANEEKVPVTPRGGGTGLSGGAVPLYGGILLSLERMNKILEIDVNNLMVTLEAGVINGNLQRENEISGRYSLSIAKFGHLGDGNIHVNILKEDMDDAQWKISESKAVKEIFELVVSLGGLISGEHGIGLAKKKYLDLAVDAAQIEVMKGIKRVFDPNNILNPGKIFDL